MVVADKLTKNARFVPIKLSHKENKAIVSNKDPKFTPNFCKDHLRVWYKYKF